MPTGSASALEKLQKAEDLKKGILGYESKLRQAAFVQDSALWKDCSALQSLYQELLLSELEFALEQRVEQDLWSVVFRQQVSHLQRLSRDRKNPRINDHAAVLKWYLDSALGFYVQLLHSFCESFGFDPNTKRLLEKRDSNPNLSRSVLYAVQSCLVHLGDLSRYRNKNKLAEHYYRHAAVILPSGGQPFNQLALLEAGKNEVLSACYLHARSLAVRNPFPAAAANLSKLLAKFASRNVENVKKGQHLSGSEYCDKFLRLQAVLFANESGNLSSKQLDELRSLVKILSTQLPPLVATQDLTAEKLLQMITLDFFALDKSCSSANGSTFSAASLVRDHLATVFLAAVLPTYTLMDDPKDYFALPVVYVLLVWMRHEVPGVVGETFASRPHVWPSLCHLLNSISKSCPEREVKPDFGVTLPEEAELRGFAPLEPAFASFRKGVEKQTEDKSSRNDAVNQERALRLIVLGKLLGEVQEDRLLSVSIQNEGQLFFEPSGRTFDQKKIENGEPSSQRVSPELSPASSSEDLSGAGVIKLPPESVKTPGILRLIDAGVDGEGKDDDNGQKGVGLAGKKNFHNVALQTIMKKSGLFDAPVKTGGKQVKFRPTTPDAATERVPNGTAGGNKVANMSNAKFRNLPPRLLAQAMNNQPGSSRDGSGDAWLHFDGGRPVSGQPVAQNAGNHPYPRPGFGQQISASLTGPRSKNPMAASFNNNVFGAPHSAPEAFRYPPPPLGPPPQQQPPGLFPGMFNQAHRMQQQFSTPSSLAGSTPMPVQNGVMSFAQQDRQSKPPLEAIGSGRVKKLEGFVHAPNAANFGPIPQQQQQRGPNGDNPPFSNQTEKPFPPHSAANAKPSGISFDLESLFRRVPPPPIAPPSRANPLMGQPPQANRMPPQFYPPPPAGDRQRLPVPSSMMNGDGGRSFGGLIGQQQQRPMSSPTKDPGLFMGKPLNGGMESHNSSNQSNLSALLGGQLPRYNEGGYSLFGPPNAKSTQQHQPPPPPQPRPVQMHSHVFPGKKAEVKHLSNGGPFLGGNTQGHGSSWSSLSNGVGSGNGGVLGHGPQQASGFSSVWNGPSPFDKLMELARSNAEKALPAGFMQKHTSDGGQPP